MVKLKPTFRDPLPVPEILLPEKLSIQGIHTMTHLRPTPAATVKRVLLDKQRKHRKEFYKSFGFKHDRSYLVTMLKKRHWLQTFALMQKTAEENLAVMEVESLLESKLAETLKATCVVSHSA